MVSYWLLAGDLLVAPLRPQKLYDIILSLGRKHIGIAIRFRFFTCKFTSLFGFIASSPELQLSSGLILVFSCRSSRAIRVGLCLNFIRPYI